MNQPCQVLYVALLVSAWIEIGLLGKISRISLVALLVSAWIEIGVISVISTRADCRTPCECVD